MSKVATIVYLPPRTLPYSAAFRANIAQFEIAYPIHFLSDSADDKFAHQIAPPDKVGVNTIGRKPPWTISNYCFLKSLQLAVQKNLEWMLFLEADCRVNGDKWDAAIWNEFQNFPAARMGGTPVCWSLNTGGRDLAMRIVDYAASYQKRAGIPMAIHGPHGNLGRAGPPCLYPNGAAAIYNVPLLARFFPDFTTDSYATRLTAWDMHIGHCMRDTFGDGVTERIAGLTSVFSGYGDNVLTEPERKEWLHSKRIVAVHQIKDSWTP